MLRWILALIWSVVYFYFSRGKIYNAWRVDVFKLRQWKELFNGWVTDRWVVDTPSEYALCIVLFLWIPLWVLGLFFIWRLTRKSDTQHVVRQTGASHPFIPAYTPASMPSQGKSAVVEPVPSAIPVEKAAIDETTNDWVPKDEGEAQALDEIAKIAEEKGLASFPHVLLEDELIPITVSSDSDALLIKALAVDGVWQAAMTEPLEQAVWSCNGQGKNVLKEIILGKNILAKMEPESRIIPVLVLAQGDLENKDVVLKWLAERGVEVVTLPSNVRDAIPQLSDILGKYFNDVKPEENNEEELSNNIQKASV